MAKQKRKYRHTGVRPGKKAGSFIIDFRDHDGVRHQRTFHGSESDAARYRRAILTKVDRIKADLEAPPEKSGPAKTLHEAWLKFVTDRNRKIHSGSMSQKSLDRVECAYNSFLDFAPTLKTRPINTISQDQFEGYMIYKREAGASDVGINTTIRMLRTFFNFCVKAGLLKQSPLASIDLIRVPRQDVRFLSDDELLQLQTAIESLDMSDQFQKDAHDLTLFYLYTGARISEVLYPVFDWSCINESKIHFPTTKAMQSRTIPTTKTVTKILASRAQTTGGPFCLSGNQAYSRVKWLFKKAGIENASPHTLRKTTGSIFYLATRDIFATSRYLGHSSVTVTEKHYAGLIQSLQAESAAQFDDALGGRLLIGCHLDPKHH